MSCYIYRKNIKHHEKIINFYYLSPCNRVYIINLSMSNWNSDTSWNENESLINVKNDKENSGVELNDIIFDIYKEKTFEIIKEVSEINLPKKNEQKRIVTFKHFNHVAFIISLINKNVEFESIILVIFSINLESARLINKLAQNGVKIKILMSNLRNKAHREKEKLTRDLFVENKNIELFFAQTHGKLSAIKTKCGNHYIIEGSGNHTKNSRIEQYVLDNDNKLYDFTDNWTEKIKEYLKGKKELVLT